MGWGTTPEYLVPYMPRDAKVVAFEGLRPLSCTSAPAARGGSGAGVLA